MLIPNSEPRSCRLSSIELLKENLYDYLDQNQVKRIIIEGPAYVAPLKYQIAATLKKIGYEIILSGDILWGACCLGWDLSHAVSADLTVHIGHDKYITSDQKAIYLPVRFTDIPVMQKLADISSNLIKYDNIKAVEVVTALEFNEYRKMFVNSLKEIGVEVLDSGRTNGTTMIGQILACASKLNSKRSSENNDPVVVIADSFFASGLHYRCGCHVLCVDPYRDRIYWLDAIDPTFELERKEVLRKAIESNVFGIIVEVRQGQNRLKQALETSKSLEKIGKTALIVGMNEVTLEKMLQYDSIEFWINTACNRLPFDNKTMNRNNTLTYSEFKELERNLNF